MSLTKRLARAILIAFAIIAAFLLIHAPDAFGQEVAAAPKVSIWDVFVTNLLDILPIFGCVLVAPWIVYREMTYRSTKLELFVTQRERDKYASDLRDERLGISDFRVISGQAH